MGVLDVKSGGLTLLLQSPRSSFAHQVVGRTVQVRLRAPQRPNGSMQSSNLPCKLLRRVHSHAMLDMAVFTHAPCAH